MAPQGRLRDGSLIPLSSAGTYPSSEQLLSAITLLLNGGGIGQVQDITESLSTALAGREQDLRSLIVQLDAFTRYVNDQSSDIIATAESLNTLAGQFADQQPVLDKALTTIRRRSGSSTTSARHWSKDSISSASSVRWSPTAPTRRKTT